MKQIQMVALCCPDPSDFSWKTLSGTWKLMMLSAVWVWWIWNKQKDVLVGMTICNHFNWERTRKNGNQHEIPRNNPMKKTSMNCLQYLDLNILPISPQILFSLLSCKHACVRWNTACLHSFGQTSRCRGNNMWQHSWSHSYDMLPHRATVTGLCFNV